MENFQGKYEHNSSEMKITLHDNDLMFYAKGGSKMKLIPIGPFQFIIPSTLNKLEFHIDENGQSFYTLTTLKQSSKWKLTESLDGFYSLDKEDLSLEAYVGKYQVSDQFVLEISSANNQLYGQVGNDLKEMICYDTDKFCAKNNDILLHFERNSNDQITSLVLKQRINLTAQRLE